MLSFLNVPHSLMSPRPRLGRVLTSELAFSTSALGHNRTHAMQQRQSYSITSSARAMRVGGMGKPSNLAVLRLIFSASELRTG